MFSVKFEFINGHEFSRDYIFPVERKINDRREILQGWRNKRI